MSMPQIPEEKNRPNLCEVTIDILKSIAMEETALSHIINAEGERSQAVVRKFQCCGCCNDITLEELTDSIRQTEKILSTIIMKEWLLLKKMETMYEISQKLDCKPKDCGRHSCCRRCQSQCIICCRCGCCRNCCRCC